MSITTSSRPTCLATRSRSTSDRASRTVATRYDVAAGTLRTTDLQGGDAPNPLVSNVINFKVQYGLDTNGDGALDTWAEATAVSGAGDWSTNAVLRATAESLARIKALRVGIIVRGEHFDRAATRAFDWVMFDCEAVDKSTCPGRLAGSIPASARGGWHYRVYETVMPSRNLLWNRCVMPPPHARVDGGRGAQEGVIVLVALVAILVMALSAAALLRSVDTAVAVAGNLGFMQAAQSAADDAIERAVAALFEQRLVVDPAVDDVANGYFASRQPAESARGVPVALQALANYPGDAPVRDAGNGNTRPLRHRAHVHRRRRRNCRQLPLGAYDRTPARHAWRTPGRTTASPGLSPVDPRRRPRQRDAIRAGLARRHSGPPPARLARTSGLIRALAEWQTEYCAGWLGCAPCGLQCSGARRGTPHPPPSLRISTHNPGKGWGRPYAGA